MPGYLWIWIQNLLCLAVVVMGPLTPEFGYRFDWGPQRLMMVFGAALVIKGAWLGIAGVRDLGSNRTPHPQPLEEGQLMTQGIYARVRHPLYSSLIHVAFGWSFLWGSAPALMVSLVLTVWLIAKARLEERLMREKFPEYEAYQQRVRGF